MSGKIMGTATRVGGLVGSNNGGTVTGYATVEITASGGEAGGLVGYNSGVVTGYALGKVTSDGVDTGGLVGNNLAAGKVTGYARGEVARGAGAAAQSFGLLVGASAAGEATGYHSGKAGESQLTGFIAGAQRTGIDGVAIDYGASPAPTESSFSSTLFFGDKPGEWTFKPGYWSAINLEGIPVDRQEVMTKL